MTVDFDGEKLTFKAKAKAAPRRRASGGKTAAGTDTKTDTKAGAKAGKKPGPKTGPAKAGSGRTPAGKSI